MKFTARQIADILEGEIIGNPDTEVYKLSKIEEGVKGSLTFLSNPKYSPYIFTTDASITIVNKDFSTEKNLNTTLIKVKDAYIAFSTLLDFYNKAKKNKRGREKPNFIASSAKIGSNEFIGAFAYVGENVTIGENVKIYSNTYIGDNVTIGNHCTFYAGVKIYADSIIGNNCTIHSGSIIGSDGFGFAPHENGTFEAIPQIGNVVIEDNVDIGANCTIDRATLGTTLIEKGVKLDNQIQIAHNVTIGKNTVIASQTGVAGSTKIGENCMIGGQVGIVGHITVGNRVKIQAQSGVGKNIKDDEVIQGTPALEYTSFNKAYVHFRNLPKIVKEIKEIKNKVNS